MNCVHALRLTLVGLALLLSQSSQAAVITGLSLDESPDTQVNLTQMDALDWGLWHFASDDTAWEMPTHRMTNGNLIRGMEPIGRYSKLRGSSSATKPPTRFSYSDGTPASANDIQATGVHSSTVNEVGMGVTVTLTLPTAAPYFVSLWVYNYNGTGTLTASLPGMTDYVHTNSFTTDGTKRVGLYSFTATADTPGDVLALDYALATIVPDTSFAHVAITGVAVQAVPEPSALSLVLLVVAGLSAWGWRRRAGRA